MQEAHSLKPRSPSKLLAALRNVLSLQQRAAPKTTLRQDNSALKHWRAVCAEFDTTVMRPSVHYLAGVGEDLASLEQFFWAAALPIILERMQEEWVLRPKGRPLPPKPSSAMAVLRGVRRIHKRMGIETVSLSVAVQACEGMLRQYAERHGPEALLPHRKEPFTREIILSFISDDLNGTRLADGSTVDWSKLEWIEWRALVCFLAQSGFRKCVVALPSGVDFGLMHLALANVVWLIRAASSALIAAPTVLQLALLAVGDMALVRPPPDKADQLSLHWGTDPIYLPYDDTEPINACRWLAKAEVARATPANGRRTTPLFVDGKGAALRQEPLNKRLRAMLALHLPESEIHKYSWHSFRSWLACALLAIVDDQGRRAVDPGTVQCLLRWRSEEALRIYGRLNPEAYGSLLTRAMLSDVRSVRTTNSHHAVVYDFDAQAAALQRGLPQLYAQARAEEAGEEEPLEGLDDSELTADAL